MAGRHAWLGACMAGGMHGWGWVCVAEWGVYGWSHARPPCEQADACTNITFPKLRWRAVKIFNHVGYIHDCGVLRC